MTDRKAAGNALTVTGFAMIAAAVCISFYNINTAREAGIASENAVSGFLQHIDELKNETPDNQGIPEIYSGIYHAELPEDTEVPEEILYESDGFTFVSLVTIPALGAELPVCSDFSMDNLKHYPCRYQGTAAENNLIIAAHNYDSHFGNIKSLQFGDEVILTDPAGNTIKYTVTETELIPGTAVEDMKSGQWDLTLFTCNLSGQSRVTVRCKRV